MNSLVPTHPRIPRGSQSGAGEMARQKFSRTGRRTPGYQVSPDHFQTASRIPTPDWAEKIPWIFSAQSGAGICEAVWKWSGETWYPGVLPPVLENFRRTISPAPDCLPLGLRGWCLLNKDIYSAVYDYTEKADLSKGYWNPKEN